MTEQMERNNPEVLEQAAFEVVKKNVVALKELADELCKTSQIPRESMDKLSVIAGNLTRDASKQWVPGGIALGLQTFVTQFATASEIPPPNLEALRILANDLAGSEAFAVAGDDEAEGVSGEALSTDNMSEAFPSETRAGTPDGTSVEPGTGNQGTGTADLASAEADVAPAKIGQASHPMAGAPPVPVGAGKSTASPPGQAVKTTEEGDQPAGPVLCGDCRGAQSAVHASACAGCGANLDPEAEIEIPLEAEDATEQAEHSATGGKGFAAWFRRFAVGPDTTKSKSSIYSEWGSARTRSKLRTELRAAVRELLRRHGVSDDTEFSVQVQHNVRGDSREPLSALVPSGTDQLMVLVAGHGPSQPRTAGDIESAALNAVRLHLRRLAKLATEAGETPEAETAVPLESPRPAPSPGQRD